MVDGYVLSWHLQISGFLKVEDAEYIWSSCCVCRLSGKVNSSHLQWLLLNPFAHAFCTSFICIFFFSVMIRCQSSFTSASSSLNQQLFLSSLWFIAPFILFVFCWTASTCGLNNLLHIKFKYSNKQRSKIICMSHISRTLQAQLRHWVIFKGPYYTLRLERACDWSILSQVPSIFLVFQNLNPLFFFICSAFALYFSLMKYLDMQNPVWDCEVRSQGKDMQEVIN